MFPLRYRLAAAFLLCASGCGAVGPRFDRDPSALRRLPALFEHDLIYVEPVTESGQKLRFLTDTGGGLFASTAAARRAGWFVGEPPESVPFPRWRPEAWVPSSVDSSLTLWDAQGTRGSDDSGMFGAPWFAGRTWILDYGAQALLLDERRRERPEGAVPLFFQRGADGQPTTSFPRVRVEVYGVALDLLLDTGAQVRLTPEAQSRLEGGDDSPLRATSFLAASFFDRFRAEHPEDRFLDNADAGVGGEPMLQVESVRIGACEVGPVWFTRRPDANFTDYMSKWMDQKVVGALGGSALGAFRVTLSYPEAWALFEPTRRPSGGRRATCGIPPRPPTPAVSPARNDLREDSQG